MEPIEVVARFKDNGTIDPVSFTWKSITYRVESTGRHWNDDQGFHILVMAQPGPGGKVYELNFDPVGMSWKIRTIGPLRNLA